MKLINRLLVPICCTVILSGCASLSQRLQSLFGREPAKEEEAVISYSEKPNLPAENKDHRMTKKRMMEEAGLGERTGSLWQMEGQGAYLFAQNTARLPGDILNIIIDGQPLKQLETKTKAIKELLDQIEAESREPADASKEAPKVVQAPPPPPPPAPAAEGGPEGKKVPGLFDVDKIPTRIVEQLKDGNYRVQGEQVFMIGKNEYKAIATGVVRSEDYNELGVSADKLLDAKFDITKSRRAGL